jgi:hypothetical protein
MSNNKQQTAVDWYIDELYKLNVKFLNSRYDNQMTTVQYNDCKEQIKKKSKEMEKEQIIRFAEDFSDERIDKQDLINAYNETYGGNK